MSQSSWLKIQGFANNEIRISGYSRKLVAKKYSDDAETRELEKINKNDAYLEWLILLQKDEDAGFGCWLEHPDSRVEMRVYGHRVGNVVRVLSERKNIKGERQWYEDRRFFLDEEITSVAAVRASRHYARIASKSFEGHRISKFTRKARHTLLEAGNIVERLCSRSWGQCAVAVTLTLPGSTPESIKALADYSGWLVNCLNQFLRDLKLGLMYFYVAEFQKRGALHYHYCIASSNLSIGIDELMSIGRKFTDRWFCLLMRMASDDFISRAGYKGHLPGVDMFARAGCGQTWRERPDIWHHYCQPIRKSVAAYFSKYASKSVADVPSSSSGQRHYPSRFWGCNQVIRKEIKKYRFEYEIQWSDGNRHPSDFIADIFEQSPPICSYSYSFEVWDSRFSNAIQARPMMTGWTDIHYFSPESFEEIHSMLRDSKSILEELAKVDNNRMDIIEFVQDSKEKQTWILREMKERLKGVEGLERAQGDLIYIQKKVFPLDCLNLLLEKRRRGITRL